MLLTADFSMFFFFLILTAYGSCNERNSKSITCIRCRRDEISYAYMEDFRQGLCFPPDSFSMQQQGNKRMNKKQNEYKMRNSLI